MASSATLPADCEAARRTSAAGVEGERNAQTTITERQSARLMAMQHDIESNPLSFQTLQERAGFEENMKFTN